MSQTSDSISSEIFRRKPYLRNYFRKMEAKSPYQLLESKKAGEYYVSLDGNPLASQFSPKTQGERLVENVQIKPTDVVFLLGLGNPHLISQISSILPPNQIFIMVGEDFRITEILWDEFLKVSLEVPGRHLFSGEEFFPLLFNYIESLPIDRVSGLKIVKNPGDTNRNPLFKEIEEKIHTVFSAKMSDLLTKFEFEKIWIKNSIWNLTQISKIPPKKYSIKSLENQFFGLSAVLVSAGPSLRKNLPWLVENRNKLFVLSCDTSLKVLIKAGILADGVVTLDAQTNSFFHFMGENLERIPLFADLVSSPTLLREPIFKSVIHSVTAKYQVDAEGSLVREVTAGGELATEVLGDVGDIQSGGSVATTAFDMLRFMGFSEVYFLGQDLAYSGREIHSTGTHHNEKWLTLVSRKNSLERINEVIIRKRETRMVPSTSGSTVLTDYVLDLYRHWFEESAKSVSNLKLYNINQDGARIEGIPELPTKEGTKQLKDVKEHGFPWRNLPPWKDVFFPDDLELSYTKEDLLIKQKSLVLLNRIHSQLESLTKELDQFSPSDSFLDSELWNQTKTEPYLRRMVRKTEIYLSRHRDLAREKQNELLIQSLKKEIRYLKRSLYPMMGEFPRNG
ncbi:MAG: DUF115 domain-containing protein [Leptospira sp.]|nr:DUF115 domain-containing protein [Leptospira sp.]